MRRCECHAAWGAASGTRSSGGPAKTGLRDPKARRPQGSQWFDRLRHVVGHSMLRAKPAGFGVNPHAVHLDGLQIEGVAAVIHHKWLSTCTICSGRHDSASKLGLKQRLMRILKYSFLVQQTAMALTAVVRGAVAYLPHRPCSALTTGA